MTLSEQIAISFTRDTWVERKKRLYTAIIARHTQAYKHKGCVCLITLIIRGHLHNSDLFDPSPFQCQFTHIGFIYLEVFTELWVSRSGVLFYFEVPVSRVLCFPALPGPVIVCPMPDCFHLCPITCTFPVYLNPVCLIPQWWVVLFRALDGDLFCINPRFKKSKVSLQSCRRVIWYDMIWYMGFIVIA